jgi:hypothetical protein
MVQTRDPNQRDVKVLTSPLFPGLDIPLEHVFGD